MRALVPIIVMLVGGIVYLIPQSGRAGELGRIAFAAGAFALCFAFAGKVVGIL